MLLASLSISASVVAWAGPSSGAVLGGQPRLSLNTANAVDKGAVGPAQLHNGGSGYDIPGKPGGDSIIALSASGRAPVYPHMAMYDHKNLTLGGESKLFCHYDGDPFVTPGYSVFRPGGNRSGTPAQTTHADMVFGASAASTARFRIARQYSSVASGFDSELNDNLLLEVSDGALWAWPLELGYGASSDQRLRLARIRMNERGRNELAPYRLRIAMNEPADHCSMEFGPAQGLSLESVSTTLSSRYCASSGQDSLVMAFEVQADRSLSGASAAATACVSSLTIRSGLAF